MLQHFINAAAPSLTGTSAAGINIDHVRYVRWWTHATFDTDAARLAAETVAFGVLEPYCVAAAPFLPPRSLTSTLTRSFGTRMETLFRASRADASSFPGSGISRRRWVSWRSGFGCSSVGATRSHRSETMSSSRRWL
jgi:hypothetical protein